MFFFCEATHGDGGVSRDVFDTCVLVGDIQVHNQIIIFRKYGANVS